MPRRHPFYCEENVWHLCREGWAGRFPREVAFISNRARAFVMWHQRAGRRSDGAVQWDYHVIALADEPREVWDLDSALGMPFDAGEYLRRSFSVELPPDRLPFFRVVDASLFVETFASDRAHMRGPDGVFHRPPPSWDPIGPPGAPSNLARFVDMDLPFAGEVLDLRAMLARYA